MIGGYEPGEWVDGALFEAFRIGRLLLGVHVDEVEQHGGGRVALAADGEHEGRAAGDVAVGECQVKR